MTIILDDEIPSDHRLGALLLSLVRHPWSAVKYEVNPSKGIRCSDWRREGYARQQYSNFLADLYTDADYVAIVDADSGFRTPGKEHPMHIWPDQVLEA